MFACSGEGRVARERPDKDLELSPQVSVAAALDLRSHLTQASGAVYLQNASGLLGQHRSCRVDAVAAGRQVAPVLGHEKEYQPIDHTQELAVEVGERDLPGPQGVAQRGVLWVAGKAFPKSLQSSFHSAAQVPS